jgi:signal transduction histidine kinase/ActR/RegA family two-component response regulator
MFSRHKKYLLITTFLVTLCFSFTVFPQSKSVTVGWFEIPNFQETNDSGDRSGYVYEFLQTIADRTGWTYNYKTGSRNQCISMLKDGDVDIVCSLCEGEQPPYSTLTTIPFGSAYFILVCRNDDDRFSFDDYTTMNGMTVASINSSFLKENFDNLQAQKHFSATLKECDSPAEALNELTHGNADLALITSLTVPTGFTIVSQYGMHQYYIAVSDRKPGLYESLDKVLNQIITENPDFEQTLLKNYIDLNTDSQLSLTREEKQFVASAPVINVYVPSDAPVLSYTLNGEFHGFVRYILDDISKTTGLSFNYVMMKNSKELITLSSQDHNSINGFVASDFKWGEKNKFRISATISDYPLVLIYLKDMDHNIHTVGYNNRNFFSESFLQQTPYTMMPFPSREAALDGVLHSECDAYVTNMYTAQELLKQHKYRKLIMSTADNMKLGFSFAVSQTSDPELISILDKGIHNMSPTVKSNYLRQSVSDNNHLTLLDLIRENYIIVILVLILFTALLCITIMQRRNSQRLAEANKNKDAFLANMSHDFRTPLTAIKGFAYLGQTEQNAKYYDQIISSSDYLLELVKDILNIQQYAQGKTLELAPEAIQSKELIQQILEVTNPRAQAKHIKIETDFTFTHQYIFVDELRIKQVFINIISNAIKYSSEGSTVWWSIRDVEKDGSVHIESKIIDHGVGMSEDFIKNKLFKAFEREHNLFSLSEGGSGLGLVITKMVVDRMGGTISVDSMLDVGTTFMLDIPLQTLTQERYAELTKKNKVEVDSFDFTGRHVLVCEDNELNTFIISNLLEKRGCIVDTAENGQIGADKFAKSSEKFYDIILMDIRMPVLDGLEATRKIRNYDRSDAKTIPIVALSANASEDDRKKSEACGMNAHLSKPIEVDELFKTLADILSK